MLVITDPRCALHAPDHEILSGGLVPYLESPIRLKKIESWLRDYNSAEDPPASAFVFEEAAEDFGLDPILAVHSKDYVDYFRTAYDAWCQDGGSTNGVVPETFPTPNMGINAMPRSAGLSPIAKAGLYCFDLSAPITETTYESAYGSAQVTLTAASRLLDPPTPSASDPKPRAVFALTRPPGHHAATAVCGGYCFLNNCAIAARWLVDRLEPGRKVGILDIDYHHGNGTQEIFYRDPRVVYASLHATNDYPYYTGSESEQGEGAGAGANRNFALPRGTGDEAYCEALEEAIAWLRSSHIQLVLVSLGVDTFIEDPICDFRLTRPVYSRIGAAIARMALPTLFVMEGGYALDELGANVGGVLVGFTQEQKKR